MKKYSKSIMIALMSIIALNLTTNSKIEAQTPKAPKPSLYQFSNKTRKEVKSKKDTIVVTKKIGNSFSLASTTVGTVENTVNSVVDDMAKNGYNVDSIAMYSYQNEGQAVLITFVFKLKEN